MTSTVSPPVASGAVAITDIKAFVKQLLDDPPIPNFDDGLDLVIKAAGLRVTDDFNDIDEHDLDPANSVSLRGTMFDLRPFRKRFLQVATYLAKGGLMRTDMTMQDVRDANELSPKTLNTPGGNESASAGIAKITAPKLSPYQGDDEDWLSWSEEAKNNLGLAGLLKFIEDPQAPIDDPHNAKSTFYFI